MNSRRTFTKGLATAALSLFAPPALAAKTVAPARARDTADLLLETVTGPVRGRDVTLASAHEHFFADFLNPADRAFMDVDWEQVTAAGIASANVLRRHGANLFVDWTTQSNGRSVLMLRDISRKTGMNIIAPSGIYKSLAPADFAGKSIDELASHFVRELTIGIDASTIRAGFIKIATTEAGPTASDTKYHRAAARAAVRTGVTIAAHSPYPPATATVVDTLVAEGFDLKRFVWGHSQCSPVEENIKIAKRGAMLAFDAISAKDDPFFHGPTDDESMLDRIETMVKAGFGDRVMVTTDASVVVHPANMQYDRHNAYLFSTFAPKLRARLGEGATWMILHDNVVYAFRRGDGVS